MDQESMDQEKCPIDFSFDPASFKVGHSVSYRINCTLPGPTKTPMMSMISSFEAAAPVAVIDFAAQPINRRATADEQAAPLVFLNSDAARYVNGSPFPVDGGFTGGVATGQIDLGAMMVHVGG